LAYDYMDRLKLRVPGKRTRLLGRVQRLVEQMDPTEQAALLEWSQARHGRQKGGTKKLGA
jgi:hypothetical protein